MTDPAAFRATYSDWRLIKGRKVVQVIFELPLEAAGQAYDVLGGMPDPGRSVWCGIARLEVTKEEANSKPSITEEAVVSIKPPARPPASLAKQIGFLCKTPKFQTFLQEKFPMRAWRESSTPNEEIAAQLVRAFCRVESRADILPGTEAEGFWKKLKSEFDAWDLAPRAGVSP
jgi:hypothetical protein